MFCLSSPLLGVKESLDVIMDEVVENIKIGMSLFDVTLVGPTKM